MVFSGESSLLCAVFYYGALKKFSPQIGVVSKYCVLRTSLFFSCVPNGVNKHTMLSGLAQIFSFVVDPNCHF